MKTILSNLFFNKFQQPGGNHSGFILILLYLLSTACAHRINIMPSLTQFKAEGASRIEKSVAYFISAENLKKQVVTPAGGGDKVKYLPYKESEPALQTILSNIFKNVYPITSLDDTQFIHAHDISYVFIPLIETASSSRSSWIWPPSDFTVTLSCKAMDSSSVIVWQTTINSEANLGLPSVHRDHGLAGKTAIEKAFSKLQQEIYLEFSENQEPEYYSPLDTVDQFDQENEYYSP